MIDYVNIFLDALFRFINGYGALLQEPSGIALILFSAGMTIIYYTGLLNLVLAIFGKDLDSFMINIIMLVCGSIISLMLFVSALTANVLTFAMIMFLFACSWARIMSMLNTTLMKYERGDPEAVKQPD